MSRVRIPLSRLRFPKHQGEPGVRSLAHDDERGFRRSAELLTSVVKWHRERYSPLTRLILGLETIRMRWVVQTKASQKQNGHSLPVMLTWSLHGSRTYDACGRRLM